MVHIINFIYPNRSKELQFKTAIRIKKWVIHTDNIHPWTVFMKDKIYLEGYKIMKKWVESWKYTDKIYKGKIKIEDLDYIV